MANENDLISRKALLDHIQQEFCEKCIEQKEDFHQIRCISCIADDVKLEVKDAPSVDAAPVVHGKWIHTTIEDDEWGGTWHKWTCSNCGNSTGSNPGGYDYCPNCGAKMDGVSDA